LECPERAYAAGFRRIGIGALLGLAEWRSDAIALAEHTEFLLRKCWRSQLTVSLPRIRPAAGGFHPRFAFSDRDLVQLLCALRVTFPQIGLVLSTRESAVLRDALMPLGVTLMSAGSRTEPGGYTGQGKESLHLTVKGRITDSICTKNGPDGELANRAGAKAECQFEVEDHRSPEEVVHALRAHDLEPVWKDWDTALLGV
jgi:2-iminoacetate synthase